MVVGAQNGTNDSDKTPIPVQVNTPDAVILSGILGEVAVNTNADIKLDQELSAESKPKISSIDKEAKITVDTDKPVTISGAVGTISLFHPQPTLS